MIKLLLGGSPCTKWSIAQKNDRETQPNSGIGWELFENYPIALEKYKPDYFLYENNKSASKAIKDEISKYLGYPLQYINSALVSAQNRGRFYVHNWECPQPQDRGILLRDILEHGVVEKEKAYCLCSDHTGTTRDYFKKHQSQVVFEPVNPLSSGKACCVTAGYANKGVHHIIDSNHSDNPNKQTWDSVIAPIPEHLVGLVCDKGRIYHIVGGKIETKSGVWDVNLPDGYYLIRKLTVNECKRLQTVPDWYSFPVSDTQAYKQLGNGWTIEAIKHQLSHIPGIFTEDIEVLSMYDGMSCGQIALKEMGCKVVRYYSTEIDPYAIKTTQHNFPNTIQLGDAFQVRERGWHI